MSDRKRFTAAVLLVLSLLLLGTAATPFGQSAELALSASAGFDGYYKGNFWVPVYVNASNSGPPVEARLEIAVGSATTGNEVVYTSPLNLPTRSNKRLVIYVYLPNLIDRLTVELLDADNRKLATVETNSLDRLNLQDLLYGVVTSTPGVLDNLENVTGGRQEAAVAYLQPEMLPPVATALNALDVLILHDVDTGVLSRDQLGSLNSWIEGGGQLVVSGGPGWQKTTITLESLLPVAITGTRSVEDLPTLADEAGMPFRDTGPYLLTEATLRDGAALLRQDDRPLLARRPLGRGAVYFLALDPGLAPLVDWQGSERVWSEVVGRIAALPPWALGAQNSYAAASAVSSLPSLSLPSTVQLILFLVIYVGAVGPANYLVLRRIGRRELAWLTVPLLVLLFSATAYVAGFQLKGNDTVINQMSVAFGEADSDRMRVQTLLGLYSPRRRTYQLTLPADALARPFERSFGSLAGGGSLDAVERSDVVTLRNVRVDVSDVDTFVVDSFQEAPALAGSASLDLSGNSAQLLVTVQNNSDLVLETATLIFGTRAFALGDLGPGERVSTSERISSAQASALSATGPGLRPMPAPAPSVSPIMTNIEVLLGSGNYFNDRDLYPRWQLLQALNNDLTGLQGVYPGNRVSLFAWSERPQVEAALQEAEFDSLATTLYVFEIPFDQVSFSGRGLTVPPTMLSWRIIEQQGAFNASPEGLLLGPEGWIIFEFEPWQELQALQPTGLSVALAPQVPGSDLPRVFIWNWSTEAWDQLADLSGGSVRLEDARPYLDDLNHSRLRLENSTGNTLDILSIQPILSGDME